MAGFVRRALQPSSAAAQLLLRGSSMSRSFASDALTTTELKDGEAGIISGIPEEHLRRRVIIYCPSRTATQQGSSRVGRWKINFVSTQKWENPLMGWTSTGDPYAYVGEAALEFHSKEAAIEFVKKHGWEFTVKEPHKPLLRPKSYADNFKWKGPPASEDE
eukprot:TRINITY_DN10880_c0_g1_i1.p1 TRINITY_DN10880_c0_g1~~TRINITY_DN10880_c0_g1_i1.p1  ORF type:complete len:161 (+),score=28.73 TRINITY_DN10880_c0_g1_i1:252-734(+)